MVLLHNAASAASTSPLRETGLLSQWLQAIGALLATTRPNDRARAVHLYWLGALIAAGAAVRFWGLGAVGLHGDEETMAMAVRHILIDGRPTLPSGMFYPRGLTQLYLMALSVAVFGETEWALRLPSALCGVALIGLAYAAGRRFLRPCWSLAFAASIAFLPMLILDSQTARMYIFLVAAVMGSLACLFAWERTGRAPWLVGAATMLALGLDMHALAVGVVLIFFAPGLVSGDRRQLGRGALAALGVLVAYVLLHSWVNAQYPATPPEFGAELGAPAPSRSIEVRDFNLAFDLALWSTGVVIAVLAIHVVRTVATRAAFVASAVLLLVAIALQLALYYHLAMLSYLAGLIVALRYGCADAPRRAAFLVLAATALFVVHVALLASASGTFVKLIGALIGEPSVWPYARIAQISPVAGALTAVLLFFGLYQFLRARRAPDYWLLAVLGVWAPVFALGAFAWNVPSRYTEMSLAPMLLCAFATAQGGWDWLRQAAAARGRALSSALGAAIAAIAVINPVGAAAAVNTDYRTHPDHKGAAEFMRSLSVTDEDIVIAEDVLQQTYYLGRVDYWLIRPEVARKFTVRSDAGLVDFYTHTPVIVSTAMLDALLENNRHRRIFVIGTGEGWSRGVRGVRGEMHAALESDRFETIYSGRDGLTRVLRSAPAAAGSAQGPRSPTEDASIEDAAASAPLAEADRRQAGARAKLFSTE